MKGFGTVWRSGSLSTSELRTAERPGRKQVHGFFGRHRLNRLLAAVLIGLAASTILSWWVDGSREGAVARGDFPAFYAAAKILHSNRPDMLYDPLLQRRIENESWPGLGGRYLAYAYPPFVAQALSPLGRFSAPTAKFIFMALMALALVSTLPALQRWFPWTRERPWFAVGLLLIFPPYTAAILGGQNTPLSLLLSLAITALLWDERELTGGRRMLAGALLGLWLFKPHFALFAALPLAVLFGAPFVAGFSAIALGLYLLSVPQFGVLWPWSWLAQAAQFGVADAAANQHQMVSLVAALKALLGSTAATEESWIATGFSVGISLVGGLAISWWAYRESARNFSAAARRVLLLIPAAVVLLSPHTMFYDSALCLPTLAYLWRVRNDADVVAVIIFFLFSFVCVSVRELLSFQPLVIIPLSTVLLVVTRPRDTFE